MPQELIVDCGIENDCIEWAVSSRMLGGENVCGDLHVIATTKSGALVAVLDGLGHGEEAALASNQAKSIIEENANENLSELIERCHNGTRNTRGLAMTVCAIDSQRDELTWGGVGNVEAVLLRADSSLKDETLLTSSGIVGYKLPRLRISVLPLQPDDLFILHTDGISDRFVDSVFRSGSLDKIADNIINKFGKRSDDALVVVFRYLGRAST